MIGVKRIPCLLAVAVTLAMLGAPAAAHAEDTRPAPIAPASLAPVAMPDLGGIFGDENEADENESDEGGSEDRGQSQKSSGVGLPVLFFLLGIGLGVGRFAFIRPRRRG